ncbi:QacE family quaternary ammonium compound efflux SMR transporter (plasmid) [Rhodococcus oxybenzonivorans]|uniref:QacE family quaternary ammonium compound efflux SMR transporter n=1 Tax=Rhodococcus oxybenzonivorans TaxID=1990687 RepID=A0A2S2C6Z0_9NOCA|nr:SMR family transporter [Rhodococcus oxybenzonivorans]AWK76574.1 QacE family quaternary ammonium compound efflux SMR transporter [Rhodococcus oxybenzonivorans]
MAWLLLVTAIVLEVAATSMLPLTHEFTRVRLSAAVLGLYGSAFFLLAKAVIQIDIGVVYALWSALGTAAVVALGALFHGERISRVKIVGLALTVVGIVAMNFGG